MSGVPERTDAHDLNLMRRLANQIATALSQAGVKVMLCDIEEAALAKALADLKLTNADVDGVKAASQSRKSSRPQPTQQSRGITRSIYWLTMLGLAVAAPMVDGRELELDPRRPGGV